jgi:hypothetical protein
MIVVFDKEPGDWVVATGYSRLQEGSTCTKCLVI